MNNGISENLLQVLKNLELGLDILSGTIHSQSNYSFHYNYSYFIQACVPLPFVIAIGNLDFIFCDLYRLKIVYLS